MGMVMGKGRVEMKGEEQLYGQKHGQSFYDSQPRRL